MNSPQLPHKTTQLCIISIFHILIDSSSLLLGHSQHALHSCTEASPEQQAFLALLARSAPRLPQTCNCPWDPYCCCHCKPPDPWEDWDRPDVIWASLASSNVVYSVLNTTRLFAVRIFHSDSKALLDALIHRLLKQQHVSCWGVVAMIDTPPWPSSKLRLQPCAPICGRAFTSAIVRQRTPRLKHVTASATLYVRLGLAPYSDPDPVSWHPYLVPITLTHIGTFLFIDLPPVPFPRRQRPPRPLPPYALGPSRPS